jgi:4-hydroxy-3-polyprenylbenzoate decarboxylase
LTADIPILTDLRAFMRLLEAHGELQRVGAEVDPQLEIAAITDCVSKGAAGGRALLFERVRGHRFPLAINLFGTPQRTAWALGAETVEVLAERLAQALTTVAGSADERLQSILARPEFAPGRTARPPCREITEAVADFSLLPALQAWPGDGGRFLTLPQVFTHDPETGEGNCGMYRMQIFDGRTAGLHWRPGSDAARHHAAWQRRGEKMPVAIALGGDPALTFAAGAPLPPGVDEIAYAGFLRGSPVAMAPGVDSALRVPAGAEFVLEGYVEPGEGRLEGPFGNHTGSYAPVEPCPVFHLTTLTRRLEAIYPCTLVGPPPMEDCWLAKANERLLLPLLRIDFPQIVDLNFPVETIFHGCALLSVRTEAGGGRELLRALWRSRFFRSTRLLVLLGEGVAVQEPAQAYWQVVNCVDPELDLFIEAGRLGIDATRVAPAGRVAADAATRRLVARRWQEYGFAGMAPMSMKGPSAC